MVQALKKMNFHPHGIPLRAVAAEDVPLEYQAFKRHFPALAVAIGGSLPVLEVAQDLKMEALSPLG
jgi:hypothetical protein